MIQFLHTDIIDPAIMRPGRLDKTIYVGLPCPSDRLDILITLTKVTVVFVRANLPCQRPVTVKYDMYALFYLCLQFTL